MTEIDKAVGEVGLRLVGPGVDEVVFSGKPNCTTYKAADALASAYAGDSSYMPCKIAFLYATDSSELSDVTSVDRSSKWDDVKTEKFVLTDFSYAPSMTTTDDTVYDHNRVVFHGRTQGVPDHAIVYRACLLGRNGNNGYNLLAVVDLDSSREKPDGFELSIDWAIKFN